MRVGVYAGAMLIAWSGALAVAQTKVTTPEEFDKAMKPAGAAMRTIGKAFPSGAYADVRKELATLKTALVDTQSFWVLNKKDDAVKMNKESIAKIEAFEKLVATDPVDPAVAGPALKEIGGTCSACHKQYREQDAEGNYKIKAGTIGG
jgi:GTPase involved in cell partitioning and DNA repair